MQSETSPKFHAISGPTITESDIENISDLIRDEVDGAIDDPTAFVMVRRSWSDYKQLIAAAGETPEVNEATIPFLRGVRGVEGGVDVVVVRRATPEERAETRRLLGLKD